VCADLAIRRSLHTHETIGKSVWDWLHSGDVHEDSPDLVFAFAVASQFCRIRSRFRHFGAPSFLWGSFRKGDTWGIPVRKPGPNSKTLIILQNSD
jgi:hypothetical protein